VRENGNGSTGGVGGASEAVTSERSRAALECRSSRAASSSQSRCAPARRNELTFASGIGSEHMNRVATALPTPAARQTITHGRATIAAVAIPSLTSSSSSHTLAAVPRRTQNEKLKRDTGIIAGIRKHRALWTMRIPRKSCTRDELIATFDVHLRALVRASELTSQRAFAITEERALEARISRIARAV
jgi:hypothetical protein